MGITKAPAFRLKENVKEHHTRKTLWEIKYRIKHLNKR